MGHPGPDRALRFVSARGASQVDALVLQRPTKSPGKPDVHPAPAVVHRDPHAGRIQRAREFIAGELAALPLVDDPRRSAVRQRSRRPRCSHRCSRRRQPTSPRRGPRCPVSSSCGLGPTGAKRGCNVGEVQRSAGPGRTFGDSDEMLLSRARASCVSVRVHMRFARSQDPPASRAIPACRR